MHWFWFLIDPAIAATNQPASTSSGGREPQSLGRNRTWYCVVLHPDAAVRMCGATLGQSLRLLPRQSPPAELSHNSSLRETVNNHHDS